MLRGQSIIHLRKYDISNCHVHSFISATRLWFTLVMHALIYHVNFISVQCFITQIPYANNEISSSYIPLCHCSKFPLLLYYSLKLHLRCRISLAATLHIKLKLDLRWARQKRHRPHTWAGKHGLAIPWKILATARPVKLVSRYIHIRLRMSAINCSSFISIFCKQHTALPSLWC
jgi:hypothetical protein